MEPGNIVASVLVGILVLIVLMILISCIRIVPQATALVIERLGGYRGTWSVGDRKSTRLNSSHIH